MSTKLLLAFVTLLLISQCLFAKTEWLQHYDQAIAKAKETSRPVFIDCFADWCLWCHRLEEDVFPDPAFEKFLEGYVPLRINVEDNAEGTKIAATFGVDSLPSLLVVDPDEKLLNRVGGFQNATELIDEITSIQFLLEKEKLHPNDWDTVQTIAEEYLFRDMNREAELRFRKVVDAADASDLQKESAHFSLALALYYQQKPEEALAVLVRYLETYVDDKSLEDVLLLQSQIYIELDEEDRARSILQQFITKFPDSPNLPRAKSVLALLNRS